uniref:MYB transcription factor n=1 Tax=Tamarix hispida TaxID=189793 RepID=A0A4P8FAM9_9CARY|nr:telomere repeat-binding factor [Tamarix hispida]
MGNPKQKWTAEEEDALRAGVAKYGPGKWKFIQRDPEFNRYLHSRSNIDLKDKWRNMGAATQGSREKCRTPKVKAFQDPPALPAPDMQTSSDNPAAHELPEAHVKEETSKESHDPRNGPRYNDMIFEALLTTKEANGLDITQLLSFIEQRTEVPPNFRKSLSSRLRRLVATEKLKKVENCFIMKCKSTPEKKSVPEKKAPAMKEIQPKQPQPIQTKQPPIPDQKYVCQSLEAAAKNAASLVAEAENKSIVADVSVREAERIAQMAEDSEAILQFAQEIFEKCNRGEVVFLA